jgi:hypothetical protein
MEAPGFGAVTGNLDRNLHPQRSCGSHFKINTFRALSRSLLAPLMRGDIPSRDKVLGVDDTCGTPLRGGTSACEKVLDLSSGGGIDMLPRPVESARRGSPTASK